MAYRARSRIDDGAAVSGTAAARVARGALLFARRPWVFLGRRSYILVLGHMRSYSSVLCHVLGSHPEIAGYAEMHLPYRNVLDLLRLRSRVFRSLGCVLPGRFVLDKVLHDEYVVAPSILRREDVNAIVVVRRPAESIRSVLAMGERIPSVGWYSDVDAVVDYYVKRLRSLATVRQHAVALSLREGGGHRPANEPCPHGGRAVPRPAARADGRIRDLPAHGRTRLRGRLPHDPRRRVVRPPERGDGDVPPPALAAAITSYEECCAALGGSRRGVDVATG